MFDRLTFSTGWHVPQFDAFHSLMCSTVWRIQQSVSRVGSSKCTPTSDGVLFSEAQTSSIEELDEGQGENDAGERGSLDSYTEDVTAPVTSTVITPAMKDATNGKPLFVHSCPEFDTWRMFSFFSKMLRQSRMQAGLWCNIELEEDA